VRAAEQSNVQLNRKVLSELAMYEPITFRAISQLSSSRLKRGLRPTPSNEASHANADIVRNV
jgi:hypothetical protein